MEITINNPSPNPRPKPISFGIYKYSKPKPYGWFTHGEYKGYNIDIYDAKRENSKLYYVSDNTRRWIKSKLVYIQEGIKRIIRSENTKHGM